MIKNIKYKRIMAYLIDILVISMLIFLVSKINYFKLTDDNYSKLTEQYNEILQNMKDKTTQEILDSDYMNITYKLMKYSVKSYIVEGIIVLLYFTLFPLFNKNRTIGQQFFKLEIKSNGNKVKWYQHLSRSFLIPIWSSIILYSNLYTILNIVLLYTFKNSTYIYISSTITLLITIYCYVDVIMLFTSKKKKSLHDIITRTYIEES